MRGREILLPSLLVASLVAGWQAFSACGILNPALLPPPMRILSSLAALFQRGLPGHSFLLTHVTATLVRVLEAFALGLIVALVLGIAMGVSPLLHRALSPLIAILMPIPGIALAPLFIVWFGFGDPTIVTLGALSALFPLVYNTAIGVRSVDRQLVRAAETMGMTRSKILLSVHLPWAAAYIFTGVKLGLARCWMTVIAVEFIAATNWGLGYMIWNAAEYLRADIVYGGIGVLIVSYYVLERGVVRVLERNTIEKWGMVRT